MSGTKNRPHKRRNIILLVLLALLCIGGVELLVCRFAAPELFQRLTAPVAGLMQRVSDFGEHYTAICRSCFPDRGKMKW